MSTPGAPAGLSPSNPALQQLRRLSRRRSARSEAGAFLVDGPTLLAEALAAGTELEAVYAEPAALRHPSVVAASRSGVPVREVAAGALAKVLDVVTPQDVVAVARPGAAALDAVLDAAAAERRPVLVLVELQDPGNVGTLLRVAEGAGCAGVLLTPRSVDVHNPKAVRASAGSVFRVPAVEGVEASDLLPACARRGIPLWATVRDGGVAHDGAPLGGACALLVGSEAHGLPDDVLTDDVGRLTIPMAGTVESLNAGVAGALVAFEAARQRRSTGTGDGGPEPVSGVAPAVRHDVPGPVGTDRAQDERGPTP